MPETFHSDTSLWQSWTDADEALHIRITISAEDQQKLEPGVLEKLREVGRLLHAAFAESQPPGAQ